MRRHLLCMLSLAAATAWGTARAETAGQVFAQVSPSVVVVVAYDAAGKPAELGSGVVLPDGNVATNCHVLKGGTLYRVRYKGSDYAAQMRFSDWNRDVCSLSVSGLKAPKVVMGSTASLKVGDQVYAIGTPEGLELTLSEGIVSSLRSVEGGTYIQTTAAISPGSSGGGLFDNHGKLLGLTSFFVTKGQQLNFALPVEWVEALPQHSTARTAGRVSEVSWLNRAAALESRKDWRGLQALAEWWTLVQPGVSTAWFALGEAYDADGEHAQAIGAYRQAIKINPQNADSWYDLGILYGRVGQYVDAVGALHQALQIDQQYEKAWVQLGATQLVVHQFAEAINSERRALQLNLEDENAWTDLGIAYASIGKNAESISAYRQAVQIDPQDALAWDGLGLAYAAAGQRDEAITVYQHLKRLDPALARGLFDQIVPK